MKVSGVFGELELGPVVEVGVNEGRSADYSIHEEKGRHAKPLAVMIGILFGC